MSLGAAHRLSPVVRRRVLPDTHAVHVQWGQQPEYFPARDHRVEVLVVVLVPAGSRTLVANPQVHRVGTHAKRVRRPGDVGIGI